MNTSSMVKVVVVVGFLSVTSRTLPAEDTWTKKADMPTATSFHSASVVDGKIYVIGGTDNLGSWAYWSTMLMYDPAADTWTKKADMPTARARLSTSVVDGKIYAIGGSPHRDADLPAVEVYDPATDTWTKKADMPRARNWHSSSVVNGKIYAIGGKIYPSETMVSTVQEYDPATDTWTPKANMPTARSCHSASVVDGKIYAIGGGVGWVPCVSTMEVYDPGTDTWTKGADMPTARGGHSASVVNGKIYVIGGFLNPSTWAPTAAVEVYDPNPFVVDFNADEIVNFTDFSMLAQYWYDDQSPFVDHRLDYEDLAVLADYWLMEVLPASLIAYWKLDETEGLVAHDSVGDNDGILPIQNPLWRPLDGQVGGALELDGVDDFVLTEFVLDPGGGPLSVFAWVKGGAPGQVIISQTTGANWLLADPATGALMTELKGNGRFDGPLSSQAVITDGDWHRVSLTWDGSNRILCVDDVEVAGDTQADLAGSTGRLYFGAAKNLGAGSFWSGLIDDVRIYDRAIVP